MPDLPTIAGPAQASPTTVRPTQHALLTALAEAVLAVPGVVRLEPTLSTSGPRVLLRRSPTDGIHLIDRAGVTDVDISLATSNTSQARDVAHHVQDVVAALLTNHHRTRGSVAVSVLTIEP